MKQFKMLLLASIILLFTACAGGGGSSSDSTVSVNPETPQTIAIDKIMAYANDNTQPAPTLLTYNTAGVVGVTSENVDDINNIVASLSPSDVDTTEEIQKIVDDLGINIRPIANAGSDKNVEVNNTIIITGSGTDTDGTIVSYAWKKGSTVLAATASFDYTPTATGIDTLTLTITDDDGATATDSMAVTVTPPLNTPPTADAGSDKNVEVNNTITITGSGTDTDGTIVSYAWKKGSTVLAATASLDYTPTAMGTDTLTLTVADDDGATATDNMAVTVTATPSSTVQKGPYLIYDGVNTEMRVLWQLDSSRSCTIDWGEDASYAKGSAGTSENGNGTYNHQHIYTITGLTPGTHYFYKVTCDSNYIGRGSFHSAPSDDADNVKFMVYGDTRSYPADHDSVNYQMINTYTTDPEYQTITLHVGDWVNNGDLEADWDNQFFDSYYTNTNKFQANMPINGVRGNHEGSGDLFYKYFPYLYEAGGFYWSFDYGPVHVIVIDQYVDCSPGSTQYIWLENDLSSSTKKWKILVFHEPGWSADGPHSNNVDVQNYIQPLAVEKGVNIIFAGHNHYYARATVDSIQHITTGGGGAPLYLPDPNYENVVATAQSHHFCEVEIQGDDLYFTARDASGLVLDSFYMD